MTKIQEVATWEPWTCKASCHPCSRRDSGFARENRRPFLPMILGSNDFEGRIGMTPMYIARPRCFFHFVLPFDPPLFQHFVTRTDPFWPDWLPLKNVSSFRHQLSISVAFVSTMQGSFPWGVRYHHNLPCFACRSWRCSGAITWDLPILEPNLFAKDDSHVDEGDGWFVEDGRSSTYWAVWLHEPKLQSLKTWCFCEPPAYCICNIPDEEKLAENHILNFVPCCMNHAVTLPSILRRSLHKACRIDRTSMTGDDASLDVSAS